LTEGNAKKPSFRDSLGNFLDFSRFPFKTDKTDQIPIQNQPQTYNLDYLKLAMRALIMNIPVELVELILLSE